NMSIPTNSRTTNASPPVLHHSPNPNPNSVPITGQSHTQLIDNNSHPLYLHNNDQPGMILISKKLLGSICAELKYKEISRRLSTYTKMAKTQFERSFVCCPV
ncbi:hypothetical protein ACR2XR_26165, partial [Klebsiella pneumoniae]